MTTVKSPLFSIDARGSLGKQLSFFMNYKSHTVGTIAKTPYRNTQLQKNVRGVYIDVYDDWKIATQSIKDYFKEQAEGKRLNPYNVFFKLWFESIYQARYSSAIYGIGRYN